MDATLVLQSDSDVDDNELDELTIDLRRRLLEDMDISAVQHAVSGSVPHNAKSADVAEVGALMLTLSPMALRSMFQLVQEWLKYRPVRTTKVAIGDDSIELTHLSDADQRRLIDAFIERHAVD